MTFKNALFCWPLNKSITICITENPRYNTAGGHNESIIILNQKSNITYINILFCIVHCASIHSCIITTNSWF